jgi:tRNA(Ile)-lysidine synthase TilS/MesJ
MKKEKNETFIKLLKFNNHVLQEKKILKPNTFLLLAISGGQDSIFLFFFIVHLKRQWNWKIAFVWCNHLWQIESFFTMCHVFKIAYFAKLPINFAITQKFLVSEEKSRIWRFITLQRLSFFSKSTYLLNGHTASDLIETAVFHVLRGSGSNGLFSSKPLVVNNWKNFFPPASTMYSNFSKTLSLNKFNILEKKVFTQTKTVFFSIKNFEQKPRNLRQRFFKNKKFISNFQQASSVTLSPWSRFNTDGPLVFDPQGKYTVVTSTLVLDVSAHQVTKREKRSFLAFSLKATGEKERKRQLYIFKSFNYFSFIFQKNTHLIIVRPLGSIHRYDIQQTCLLWKMPVYPDQSNQKLYFMRNRLRNQVLPTFRFFFNTKTDRVLYQFIGIKEAEHFYFNLVVQKILNNVKIKQQKNVALNIKFLQTLPLAIQRRVLKFILKDCIKLSLSFYHIESILKTLSLHRKVFLSDSDFLALDHITVRFFENKLKKSSSMGLKQQTFYSCSEKFFQIFLSQTPEYIFIPKKGILFSDLFLHFIY